MLVMDSIDSFTLTGRRVEAAEPPSPTVEDCYRNLVAAILLQAKKDLAEPGYRTHAVRWLRSNGARTCLLYTSPSPRDRTRSRMPSSA